MTARLRLRRNQNGIHAAYSGRCRVGYVVEREDGSFYWELTMHSEHFRGHPRGSTTTEEIALASLDQMFGVWAQAANLKRTT